MATLIALMKILGFLIRAIIIGAGVLAHRSKKKNLAVNVIAVRQMYQNPIMNSGKVMPNICKMSSTQNQKTWSYFKDTM